MLLCRMKFFCLNRKIEVIQMMIVQTKFQSDRAQYLPSEFCLFSWLQLTATVRARHEPKRRQAHSHGGHPWRIV